MLLFTSKHEKRFWLWALVIYALIFSTLFFGQPLAKVFSNQDIQAAVFMLGMLLVVIAIITHTLKTRSGKIEIAVLVGIVAVYIMFFLRLGLAERSHLIEYSVLAIIVHKAIIERIGPEKQVFKSAMLGFVFTFVLGVLDECMQLFLPDRVFDPVDIFFNGVAAGLAIGSSVVLHWIRNRSKKSG